MEHSRKYENWALICDLGILITLKKSRSEYAETKNTVDKNYCACFRSDFSYWHWANILSLMNECQITYAADESPFCH